MNVRPQVSVLLSIIAAMSFGGCSDHNGSNNTLKDIANPGAPNGQNVLVWIDQGKVSQGKCTLNTPINRANCSNQVVQKPLEESRRLAAAAGQSEATKGASDVANEIKRLKDADPTINALRAQLQILNNQKSDLTSSSGIVDKRLKDTADRKIKVEAGIVNYDQQIAAVEIRLKETPNDEDLLALLRDLKSERAAQASALVSLDSEISDLTKRLTWERSELAAVTVEISEKEKTLKSVYDGLVVMSPNLVILQAAQDLIVTSQAALASVFDYLERQDIVYHGNLLSAAQMKALNWIVSVVPAVGLRQGRYIVESGHSSFCPQKVQTFVEGSVLKSVSLTYLSPCHSATNNYSCEGQVCKYGSSSYLTVLSEDHYQYNDSPNNAVFRFSSAD